MLSDRGRERRGDQKVDKIMLRMRHMQLNRHKDNEGETKRVEEIDTGRARTGEGKR